MAEVVFLASLQDYQSSRVEQVAARLKAERADLSVRVLTVAESTAVLAKHKLKFGPAVLIDGRLEFVGVPRYRMLLDRIAKSGQAGGAPSAGAVEAAPSAEGAGPS